MSAVCNHPVIASGAGLSEAQLERDLSEFDNTLLWAVVDALVAHGERLKRDGMLLSNWSRVPLNCPSREA